ncbi:MAG: SBBP repeat-containing protein [Limisphaerales bacterium]
MAATEVTTTPSPVRRVCETSLVHPGLAAASQRPPARRLAGAIRRCAVLALAAGLLANAALAEMPGYRWASRAGGTGQDFGTGIAVDSEGNTYTCGYFRGQARFEEYALAGKGEADIFIAKYDRVGKLVWVRQAGGSADDFARAVAIDSEGNCYVTGSFQSPTIDFGGESVKRNSDSEIFIAKFDGSGKVLWVRQAGGTGGGSGNGVAVGPDGYVYVAGYFSGDTTFGDLTLKNSGFNDIFVARYDTNGELDWVRQIGGTGDDAASAIAVDAQGDSYVVGGFEDNVRFSRTITLGSAGYVDSFIAKLDNTGRTVWAQRAGGPNSDIAYGVGLDPQGNVLVSGGFNGTESYASEMRLHAAFRSRKGTKTGMFSGKGLRSEGGADVFVSKYDQRGRLTWVRTFGGNKIGAPEAGYGLAVDASGHAHITGTFAGRVQFGNNTLFSMGIADIFVAELDREGIVMWARQAGAQFSDPHSGNAIAVDRGGNSYIIGYYRGNVAFGDYVLKSLGDTDIFVAKITAQSAPRR